jgi:hypothetical protein
MRNEESRKELEAITDYFFINRFSENRLRFEKPFYYYGEWLDRFATGSAYQHGDLESRKVIDRMNELKMLENFRQTGLNRKW